MSFASFDEIRAKKHLSDLDDGQISTIVGRRNHKRHYRSDYELTKDLKESNYFKSYGKRAGRRMERRGGNKKVCRDSKHLPW